MQSEVRRVTHRSGRWRHLGFGLPGPLPAVGVRVERHHFGCLVACRALGQLAVEQAPVPGESAARGGCWFDDGVRQRAGQFGETASSVQLPHGAGRVDDRADQAGIRLSQSPGERAGIEDTGKQAELQHQVGEALDGGWVGLDLELGRGHDRGGLQRDANVAR